MNIVKKISFSAIVVAATLGLSVSDTKADSLDRLAVSLCESAKSDDRRTMRKKLDTARIRLKAVYSGIRCGAEGSLLRVATNAGSMNAAKYITAKINKKLLTKPEDDGITIIQFAEKLVSNGDASKQAFVDMYNSKI
ncbi:DUF3718 domain-containing protein [Aliikangiella coralliicola]|uniref:DUF3718 domain-containing protein n=1 Tax=Aliikangiella coralliicola TaxID=2592383 RepID=A0A545TW76_9GAMM|nr:DUF3718 domain-containing protein [Aliikangiella coralliicola]TQV81454.1 DUF3718 domain-containing protein [Aliikangiella coralliicola]